MSPTSLCSDQPMTEENDNEISSTQDNMKNYSVCKYLLSYNFKEGKMCNLAPKLFFFFNLSMNKLEYYRNLNRFKSICLNDIVIPIFLINPTVT